MFTHIHGHSTYSFLEAIGTPTNIVKYAKSLGMKGIAITDFGGMYSAIQLYQIAKEEGITPLLGVELGFTPDVAGFKGHMRIGNACFIAMNSQGYLNLVKMVSFANTEGIETRSKIDFSVLSKYSEGVLAFFGGKDSWLGQNILNGEDDAKNKELIQKFISILGKEKVFLEIIAQPHDEIEDLEKVNSTILHYAKELDLSVVVDNVYNYLSPKDRKTWEIALAIKDGKKIYDETRRKPTGEFSLQTEEEIIVTCKKNGFTDEQIFSWISNNNAIADCVDVNITMHQSLFPVHQTPSIIEKLYEQYKDTLVLKIS